MMRCSSAAVFPACGMVVSAARVWLLTLWVFAIETGEAVEPPVQRVADAVFQASGGNATVVPLLRQRRLRGSDSLPPFILRLEKVHLYTAQGSDRFRTYVNKIVAAIAQSLNLAIFFVEPVALLVYRDLAQSGNFLNQRDYGNLVLLFQIITDCGHDRDLCQQEHEKWSQAWRDVVSDPNSTVAETFIGQVDETFQHELTPSLCVKWEIRGPGCSTTQYYTVRRREEAEGFPLWFVMGVATMFVLMCALYPVSRIIKVQRRGRHLPTVGGGASVQAEKPDLTKLKREHVAVSSLGEDATCPICLSKPSDELSEEVLIPPCKHCMHVSCAEAWFAKHVQCPLCRLSFKADECVVWILAEGGHPAEASASTRATDRATDSVSLASESTIVSEAVGANPNLATAPNLIGSPSVQTAEAERGEERSADLAETSEQRDPRPGSGNASQVPVITTLPDPRSSLMRVQLQGLRV